MPRVPRTGNAVGTGRGRRRPRVAQRQARSVAAAAPGRPHDHGAAKPGGAGVKLEYRLDATPRVGQATPVVLQFDGVTDAEGATVRLSADKGLALQGSSTLALPAGKRTTATVVVVSEAEGLAYLNVFIRHGGASSAVSVPIQTGTAAPTLKSSGEMKSTPGGDSIITMPVK